MIDEGRISRYELYDPLHRFAILADVAPYSDEYKYYAKYVTQEYSDITGTVGPEREEKLRIKEFISETKKRVAQQKKNIASSLIGLSTQILSNNKCMSQKL